MRSNSSSLSLVGNSIMMSSSLASAASGTTVAIHRCVLARENVPRKADWTRNDDDDDDALAVLVMIAAEGVKAATRATEQTTANILVLALHFIVFKFCLFFFNLPHVGSQNTVYPSKRMPFCSLNDFRIAKLELDGLRIRCNDL